MKLQSNPAVFRQDLIAFARCYGWSGDFVEVSSFIKWIGDELQMPIINEELEPFDNEELVEASSYESQSHYFDLWPKETGMPFHIFIADKTMSPKEPHFLAPTQALLDVKVFKLSDYKIISLIQPMQIVEPIDLFIQNFRRFNRQTLLKFWNCEIGIDEIKKAIVVDTYLQ